MEKSTALTLTEKELLELERILLDEDGKAALEFLEKSILQKFKGGKEETQWHLRMLDKSHYKRR